MPDSNLLKKTKQLIMTSKKYFNWFEDLAGNLITERGRFNLIETDLNGLPKAKGLQPIPGNSKFGYDNRTAKRSEPVRNTKVSFFDKVMLKFPAIKNLIIGIVDLFSKGAASKIEQSINLLLTNEEEKKSSQLNIGDGKMLNAIKSFIAPKLVQWIMKLCGGILAGLGVSENSVVELVTGILLFALSAVWSLIKTGKIALTDPSEFRKLE
ncbi:MAG: hypothetical protein AB1432_11640 [Bacteroidota bacterium]